MSYGQELEALADSRGIIPADAAEKLRALRSAEMWVRYDSIVVVLLVCAGLALLVAFFARRRVTFFLAVVFFAVFFFRLGLIT